MVRCAIALVALLGLIGCGGGSRYSSAKAGLRTAPVLYATGPIQRACQTQARRAASRARCGCIQAVANRSLSSADQKRGARYFKNPAKLQEVRQSDIASNERFWKQWKSYGQQAAKLCAGT